MTKHRYADLWKQEVKARRVQLDRDKGLPKRPLVAPPAMRRRMALLWLIANFFEGRMSVGRMYCPPMTEDMHWLLRHGHLSLERKKFWDGYTRTTVLSVTDAGRTALVAAPVSRADVRWIEAAYAHDILT